MYAHRRAWKYRTDLPHIVTDRQYIIEALAGEFVHVPGTVARQINSDLLHERNCFPSHSGRLHPSAEYLKMISSLITKQPLGPSGYGQSSRAENPYRFLLIPSFPSQATVGLTARMNPLKNFPSIWVGSIWIGMICPDRNSRASSAV